MTETVDVYWSFRSPYSYLVTPDLVRLQEEFDVDVQLRIVYPIAIRDPSLLFDPSNPKKPMYIAMDSLRRAEFLGMPLARPRPSPVVHHRQHQHVGRRVSHRRVPVGQRG